MHKLKQYILSIEELKALLGDRNITIISEKTGLSYPTVYNLLNERYTGSHSVHTIIKLTDYFRKNGYA